MRRANDAITQLTTANTNTTPTKNDEFDGD